MTFPGTDENLLRQEFKDLSGREAIQSGICNPDYMLWLEAKINLISYSAHNDRDIPKDRSELIEKGV